MSHDSLDSDTCLRATRAPRTRSGSLAVTWLRGALLALAVLAPASSPAQSATDIVMAALDALHSTYPRTVSTRVRLKDREVTQTWQALDARRFRFTQTPAENLPEVIVWGDNAYLREPTGWYRKALNAAPVDLGSTDWMRRALGNTLSEAAHLPDTVLHGVAVRRYAAQVRYEDAVGVYVGRFELWLDATSSLPLHSTFNGWYAGQPLKINTDIDYITVPALAPPVPVLNPP